MRTGQLGVTGKTRLCCAIICLVLLLSASISAQSRPGRTNTNTANAVLHIHINIIPTVVTPKPKETAPTSSGISYIIPIVSQQDQTIVQETAAPQFAVPCNVQTCSAVLRTTTVVAY